MVTRWEKMRARVEFCRPILGRVAARDDKVDGKVPIKTRGAAPSSDRGREIVFVVVACVRALERGSGGRKNRW
jgi:hypothetical protein